MFKYLYTFSILTPRLSNEWDRKKRLNEKLRKEHGKTFATLRRFIFVNIDFCEIQFLAYFFRVSNFLIFRVDLFPRMKKFRLNIYSSLLDM